MYPFTLIMKKLNYIIPNEFISIVLNMPIKCAFIDPSSGNGCEEEAKYKFKHDAKASRCKAHMLEGMKNAS